MGRPKVIPSMGPACSDDPLRHVTIRGPPVEMLAEEQPHLHCLPDHAYTLAFGETRTVGAEQPTVQHDWCVYSVPWQLRGEVVWVREDGENIVVIHVGDAGPVEVARHLRTTPGNPRIDDAHFPPAPEGSLHRTPVAQNPEEAAFLSLGPGAAHPAPLAVFTKSLGGEFSLYGKPQFKSLSAAIISSSDDDGPGGWTAWSRGLPFGVTRWHPSRPPRPGGSGPRALRVVALTCVVIAVGLVAMTARIWSRDWPPPCRPHDAA
jgi:hypothetical protein